LNYLRDGAVALPERKDELMEILTEAKYYCIQQLIEQVEQVSFLHASGPVREQRVYVRKSLY